MITIRRPKVNDVSKIEKIAKEYTDNPLVDIFETASIIETEEDIKAFGVLRKNIEVIFYCTGTNRDKVDSILKFSSQAIEDAKLLGYTEIYTFAQDEKFAKILEKRFGFHRTKGISLILDLEK